MPILVEILAQKLGIQATLSTVHASEPVDHNNRMELDVKSDWKPCWILCYMAASNEM